MVLSFDNVKSKYPDEEFILLLPSVSKHIVANRPMYSLDVSTVKIDPHDKDLVYKMKEVWDPKDRTFLITEMGLSKCAIDLICAAADVNVMTERTDNTLNPLYAAYRATAMMMTAGGTVRGRTATVEWDGELMKERCLQRATKYVQNAVNSQWDGKSPVGTPWKDLSQDQVALVIQDRSNSAWLDEREFGKRKCESKAARNAARSLLAMKSTYHPRDLETKQFAIAKLVLTPDMDDPVQRRLVVEAGMKAQNHLYGFNAATQAGGTFLPEGTTQALTGPAGGPAEEDAIVEQENGHSIEGSQEAEPQKGEFLPPDGQEVKEPINFSNWSDAEPFVSKIAMALVNWSGDIVTRDQIKGSYSKAIKAKNFSTLEYIANFIIEQGGEL